jgi:hypothetical protein
VQVAIETNSSVRDVLWLLEHEPDLFATTVAYLEWKAFEQGKQR